MTYTGGVTRRSRRFARRSWRRRRPQENVRPGGHGGHTSLGRIEHVRAGVLDIAYAEFGPRSGQAVVLLHGWPYDAHSYVDVAPLLAAEGYRVLVPFLRGYGATRFLLPHAVRNGQQSAVALDVIAFTDALRIDRAVLGGFDWGARTVGVVAAVWPRRCKAIVAVSGYLVTNLAENLEPLPPAVERNWWYQCYFATERGALGYRRDRHGFNKLIWRTASPAWDFDDATYDRSAASFENLDHVAIVIHNYRWRLGLAPGEARYERAGAGRRAGGHDRQRLRRRGRGRRVLPRQVHRPVRPPGVRGHRPQRPAGGAAAVRAGGRRR
ncbi:alpha/beta fold hydrolase [Saccharothrix texasensis]|uniref:alpha/beta fold hydrolase n=1 Tax=Saccharothrix texasensis TaxID=103734 RepID=UPI001FEA9F54|nr:alpha/beta hydrolase [Saccharothrix texasensis]